MFVQLDCMLKILNCCALYNRIQNPNCWIEQIFSVSICDGIISSRWLFCIKAWRWCHSLANAFGVFFNGGHSRSIHVQTCWKPLSDDHKSKSDSLQKEICHRAFNQTLVWLRSGRIIVLWRRNTLTIHRRHLTRKISLLIVTKDNVSIPPWIETFSSLLLQRILWAVALVITLL